MRGIASASVEYGWRVPAVRWLMLAAPFTGGVGIYAFYALQPYLLELYGDPDAYGIAGLVAAIVAGAQIVGGLRRAPAPATVPASHVRAAVDGGAERGRARADRAGRVFAAVLGLIVVWALLSPRRRRSGRRT